MVGELCELPMAALETLGCQRHPAVSRGGGAGVTCASTRPAVSCSCGSYYRHRDTNPSVLQT